MLEAWIRPKLQFQLLDQMALWAHRRCHVSPNQITALSFLVGILICPLLAFEHPMAALLCLLLTGLLDTLDGTLARQLKRSTPMGAVYDIMSDRIVECAVILGLYCIAPNTRGLDCLLMLIAIFLCVNSFLLVGLFSNNHTSKSFYYSPGLIERPEAFCFFALMILWPQSFHFLAQLFSALVLLTGMLRLFAFKRAKVSA